MKPWFGAGLAGIALSAFAGVFIGLGGYTFAYAEGASYLSNDPKACVNCHVMRDQYDGWLKAPHHANATCNDCHVPHDFVGKYWTKAEHGFRHSKGFTFNDFHEPIRIKESSREVVLENCVRCHTALVDEITSHGRTQGLGAGDLKDTTNDCIRCHASVAHGPKK